MIAEVEMMPLEDKMTLLHELQDLIRSERTREQATDLQEEVERLTGCRIHSRTKKRGEVVARVILANALLEKGMDTIKVGEIIGKDHATISYYRNLLKTWRSMPGVYEQELTIWNQINEIS